MVLLFAGTGVWFAAGRIAAARVPVLTAPFSAESLYTSGILGHAVISPDGRFAAYSTESGGKQSLWVRQLETGDNVEILDPANVTYAGLVYSPDGNALYFVRRDEPKDRRATLYRVSAFGGVPAKIADLVEGWISVSPDARQVSFVRCIQMADDNCSLIVAAADGSSERNLVTEKAPFRISDNQFSPDGRSIVFARGQSWNGANEFGLSEVAIDNGSVRPFTSRTFFDVKSLRWLPDGSGLLLTAKATQADEPKIWMAPRDGPERLVSSDASGYATVSIDRAGSRIIATRVSNDYHLFSALPDRLDQPTTLGAAIDVAVGPDGTIVYATDKGDIWSIRSDGSRQRQLTTSAASDIHPITSNDGRYIFFTSNRTGSNQIWRMNNDGTDQRQLTEHVGGYPKYVDPSDEAVYFWSEGHQELWQVPASGGVESRSPHGKFPSVSMDGTMQAVDHRDRATGKLRLVISSTQTGKVVRTVDIELGDRFAHTISWHIDGQSVRFVTRGQETDAEPVYYLWKASLNDANPKLLGQMPGTNVTQLVFSPIDDTIQFIRGKWLKDAVLIRGVDRDP